MENMGVLSMCVYLCVLCAHVFVCKTILVP